MDAFVRPKAICGDSLLPRLSAERRSAAFQRRPVSNQAAKIVWNLTRSVIFVIPRSEATRNLLFAVAETKSRFVLCASRIVGMTS